MNLPVCPECKSGKHKNCPGDAWDQEADEAVPCPCEQALHDPAEVKRIRDEREFLEILHGGETPASRPVVVDPETGQAQELADWVGQPTRQEKEADEVRRSTTQTLALDLWCVLGCDPIYFQDYVDRNGLAETWAGLCGAVSRARGVEECGHPIHDGDGGLEECVLLQHSPEHPCYGPSDVGRSEPVPWKDLRS